MSHPVHTLVSLLNEHAYTKYFLVIFQPARPFLLHKNKQGGCFYSVPCSFIRACSFNRDTRVQSTLALMNYLALNFLPFQKTSCVK